MIDMHCHLDLFPNPKQIVSKCRDADIYVLSVTTTPKAWSGTVKLAKGAHRIRTALGLHPQIAHERTSELPLFKSILPKVKYVGEIGLDGTKEHLIHWKQQEYVFTQILRFCTEAGGRIMSVHSRSAVDQTIKALINEPDSGIPILHWFTGTKNQLEQAISLGCWFSVGLPMLRSKRGLELLKRMPKERILTESDGPFVFNGQQPLTPLSMETVVSGLAKLWNEPYNETQQRLKESLKSLVSNTV